MLKFYVNHNNFQIYARLNILGTFFINLRFCGLFTFKHYFIIAIDVVFLYIDEGDQI